MDPRDGRLDLIPATTWNFEALVETGELERDWNCRVTVNGPSTNTTRLLSRESLVFVRWGSDPGGRHRGRGPLSWASTTARLHSEVERSLADEASGPVAQILTTPDGAGGDPDTDHDPLAALRRDVKAARGRALLVESTSGGWGEGTQGAPRRDWMPSRLGPNPPEALANVGNDAFMRVLAAFGMSRSLFDSSDGTSKRESLRQLHLGCIQPLARVLQHELTARLETDVKLKFDLYPADLAGRAQAFKNLVAGGVAITEALATSGLMIDSE